MQKFKTGLQETLFAMESMMTNVDSITFSELITHNADVKMCFNLKYRIVAYAVQNELIIENFKFDGEKRRFICEFAVDTILWSPDSELICCCMSKQNLIQVWSLPDPSWRCRISEGAINIAHTTWTPDSRHLLVISASNFKITIWSLVSTESTVIVSPKFIKKCYAFSKCSKYMAVVERKDFIDSVRIYSCDNFQCLKQFSIDCENAGEIYFSPDDLIIAIVSTFPDEYKVMFYTIDGRLINSFTKVDVLLGITSFCWSAKNSYIFVGDHLERIFILSGKNYGEIYSLTLPESVQSTKTTIYRIMEMPSKEETTSKERTECWEYYGVDCERPVSILQFHQGQKGNHKVIKSGIHILVVSSDGQYVAIVCSSVPNIVFIFNMRSFSFCDVIIQKEKIKGISWHPTRQILAFFSGCSHLDLWTPTSCIRMISPFDDELLIKGIEWCPNTESIILNGKQHSTILMLPLFSLRKL